MTQPQPDPGSHKSAGGDREIFLAPAVRVGLRRHVKRVFGRSALAATLTLSAVLVLPSCEQGEGDRCELDDDCASGLRCDKPALSNDGVCRAEGLPSSFQDANAPIVRVFDAATPVEDASSEDAESVDGAFDAEVDTPADASSLQDAAADAAN